MAAFKTKDNPHLIEHLHALRFCLRLSGTVALLVIGSGTNAQRVAAQPADAPLDPVYATECGACHVPYAAFLLRADDWRKVLKQLDKHFDSDASMEEKELAPIRQYLVKHARKGHSPNTESGTTPRITKTQWFRTLHREVSRGHWPAIKSQANCGACHPDAPSGHYRQLSDPLYGIE
jgi:hypothetical protein